MRGVVHSNLREILETLLDMQSIQNECRGHNRVIRYLIRDGILSMGRILSCTFVFVLGDNPWYLRIFPIFTFSVVGTILGNSFGHASQLFVVNINTCRIYHRRRRIILSSFGSFISLDNIVHITHVHEFQVRKIFQLIYHCLH